MNATAPIHCIEPRCASLATGTTCGVESSHCMNQKNPHGFIFAPHCKEAGLHMTPDQLRSAHASKFSTWKSEVTRQIELRANGVKRPYFALGERKE